MGFGEFYKPFKPNNPAAPPAPTSTATQPQARDVGKTEAEGKRKKKMTLGQRIGEKEY
jgi:hypothetical protein